MNTKKDAINKKTIKDYSITKIFPILSFLSIIIFFTVMTGGRLLSPNNYNALISDALTLIVGCCGFAFVIGCGELDFSISSIVGLSCMVTAMVGQKSIFLGIVLGILTGSVIGTINGLICVKLHLPSFIATLAMSFIYSGIVTLAIGTGSIQAPLIMLKWNNPYTKVVAILLVAVVCYIYFERKPLGRRIRSLGSGKVAALQSGVNAHSTTLIAFIICGSICGLLGVFSLMRTAMASSHSGDSVLMNILTAVLLGGMPISGGMGARFRAALLGGLTMTFLVNGMTMLGVSTYDSQLIKGIVFLISVSISYNRSGQTVIK